MSSDIEGAIANEDWDAARHLVKEALVQQPDDHWLITRLALTYYEQRDYAGALELSRRALALEPECPLALWDCAGALQMLDRPQEALAAYERITQRRIDSLAYGQCGEGRARARGLYADALYRMSHCYLAIGEGGKAAEMLQLHLQQRGPGCQSIYPIAAVRNELRQARA